MTTAQPVQLTRKDFVSNQEVKWCPGCGDYAILAQVQRILPELGVPRENIVFVSGIGCSSRFPYYMATYGVHGIHGRAPAIATGLKVARPELSVWVITGDGDGLSIGGNHFIHTMRRNVDLKILLFNNRIYGLTKGQVSPTSEQGKITKSTPLGNPDRPFEPLCVALGADASMVARVVDSDAAQLQNVLRRAAAHRGTAIIEILQNCPVFNDGAHELLTDKTTKADHQLVVEHGAPLVFGKDRKRGIRISKDFVPEVLDIPEGADPAQICAIHDERASSAALAFLLARLDPSTFPTALGILRAIERPTLSDQIAEQALRVSGNGSVPSLQQLLHAGDTWTVSAAMTGTQEDDGGETLGTGD